MHRLFSSRTTGDRKRSVILSFYSTAKINESIILILDLLFKMRSEGKYIIKDLQTSYIQSPGAGYLTNTSTIEFIKRLIDGMRANSPLRKSAVLN